MNVGDQVRFTSGRNSVTGMVRKVYDDDVVLVQRPGEGFARLLPIKEVEREES